MSGMVLGTLFTLFVVPVFYWLIAAHHQSEPVREEIEHEELKSKKPQARACGFANETGGRSELLQSIDFDNTDRRDGDRVLCGRVHDSGENRVPNAAADRRGFLKVETAGILRPG